MRKFLLFYCLLITITIPCLADDFLTNRPEPLYSNKNVSEQVKVEEESDFLPAEQAFRIESKQSNDSQRIYLTFIIADGYYLYKSRFAFISNNPQVTISAANLPKGEQKHDEFLGEVEVYRNIVEITIAINNPNKLAFNLAVKYQGCAEKGLCYPSVTTVIANGSILPASHTTIEESTKKLSWSNSSAVLSWGNIFYFFIIGLGLAFTPCVFPMLPILSSIVLRGAAGNLRAFILALTYILFMAITYAILGILMGLFGAEVNFQARLQSPWVLIPFAMFFLVFALAMFGLFELRLPTFITNPLNKASDKAHGGSLLGAAILGICSSLVISPCVTAPFMGILLHIGATGDAIGGGVSLFFLGFGMGVPLLLIAAGGGALLPKAGHWMIVVRNAFGVMLLGVVILLVARIIPSYVELILWGILALGVAIFMGTFDCSSKTKTQKFAQLLGLFLTIYAICAWVGAWQGNSDPLQPLKGIINSGTRENIDNKWQVIKTKNELVNALDTAKNNKKIALLDWSADWCRACLEMEHNIFQTPEVMEKLADFQLIRIDITETTKEQRELLNQYKLIGPPAILFFAKAGNELINARIIGEMDQQAFLKHLKTINLQ